MHEKFSDLKLALRDYTLPYLTSEVGDVSRFEVGEVALEIGEVVRLPQCLEVGEVAIVTWKHHLHEMVKITYRTNTRWRFGSCETADQFCWISLEVP